MLPAKLTAKIAATVEDLAAEADASVVLVVLRRIEGRVETGVEVVVGEAAGLVYVADTVLGELVDKCASGREEGCAHCALLAERAEAGRAALGVGAASATTVFGVVTH